MEGAEVVVTVSRTGSTVVVDAVATSPNQTVYHEKFTTTCGDGSQVIRAFFVMDGSWIQFDSNETSVLSPVDVSTLEIGTSDCSAAWWTSFSDYFKIPAGQSLHLGFENHTSGVGNWNNWNLCVSTDDERGGGDYAEYFVVRSDLFGWGDSYGSGTWTSEGYDDWDAFRANMEGANVSIDIIRDGADVTVDEVIVENELDLVPVDEDIFAVVVADNQADTVGIGVGSHNNFSAGFFSLCDSHSHSRRFFGVGRSNCGEVAAFHFLFGHADDVGEAEVFQRARDEFHTGAVNRSVDDFEVVMTFDGFGAKRERFDFLEVDAVDVFADDLDFRLVAIEFDFAYAFNFVDIFDCVNVVRSNHLCAVVPIGFIAVIFFGIMACGNHDSCGTSQISYSKR